MPISDMESSPDTARRWHRTLFTLVFIVAVVAIGRWVGNDFSGRRVAAALDWVRAHHAAASPFGPLAFYAAGTMVIVANVPTIVVIACAAVLYGSLGAAMMGMVCLLTAAVIIYAVSRMYGRSLIEPHLKRFLPMIERHFEQRGLRTVALMRLMFFAFPPSNWALAVMNIRLRDYLLGTFLGAIPHVIMWAWIGVAAVDMLSGRARFSWSAPEVWGPLAAGAALTFLSVLLQRRASRTPA